MRKTASSEGFGKPKPLPNEPGYKTAKETEKLERESKEMEARLQMLQLRMQQQKEDDEATPKIGGSRWKSGRTDKGNIRGYAKDVHEKIKRSELRMEAKRKHQTAKTMSQTTGRFDFAGSNKQESLGIGSENLQQQRLQPEQVPIQGMKTTIPPPSVMTTGGDQGKNEEAAFRSKEVHLWTVEDVTMATVRASVAVHVSVRGERNQWTHIIRNLTGGSGLHECENPWASQSTPKGHRRFAQE